MAAIPLIVGGLSIAQMAGVRLPGRTHFVPIDDPATEAPLVRDTGGVAVAAGRGTTLADRGGLRQRLRDSVGP
jgi:hypothetical protein